MVDWRLKHDGGADTMLTSPQDEGSPLFSSLLCFCGRGVSKLTINGPLIFSLFLPLIKISHEKRLNGQINGVNNGVNNDNFERP